MASMSRRAVLDRVAVVVTLAALRGAIYKTDRDRESFRRSCPSLFFTGSVQEPRCSSPRCPSHCLMPYLRR